MEHLRIRFIPIILALSVIFTSCEVGDVSRARNADELLTSDEPSSALAESSPSSQASSSNTLSREILNSGSLPSSSTPEGCFLYSDKDMKQKLKKQVSIESLKQVGWEVKTDGYEFDGEPPFLVVDQTIYLEIKRFLSGFQKTNTYTVRVSGTPSNKAGVANIYTIQDNRGIKYYLDSLSYATKTTPSNSLNRIKYGTPLIVKSGTFYMDADDMGDLFDLKIEADISQTNSVYVIAVSDSYSEEEPSTDTMTTEERFLNTKVEGTPYDCVGKILSYGNFVICGSDLTKYDGELVGKVEGINGNLVKVLWIIRMHSDTFEAWHQQYLVNPDCSYHYSYELRAIDSACVDNP